MTLWNNQAVAEANALDRALYQDLTALDTALSVDVSGLTASQQATVDAQTKAILEAIAALKEKPAVPPTEPPTEPPTNPTPDGTEPTPPPQTTTAESGSANTASPDIPDIPKTGRATSTLFGSLFIFSAFAVLAARKRKKDKTVDFR